MQPSKCGYSSIVVRPFEKWDADSVILRHCGVQWTRETSGDISITRNIQRFLTFSTSPHVLGTKYSSIVSKNRFPRSLVAFISLHYRWAKLFRNGELDDLISVEFFNKLDPFWVVNVFSSFEGKFALYLGFFISISQITDLESFFFNFTPNRFQIVVIYRTSRPCRIYQSFKVFYILR